MNCSLVYPRTETLICRIPDEQVPQIGKLAVCGVLNCKKQLEKGRWCSFREYFSHEKPL